MPRVQLSGGAYQARSVIASAQRSLNLYPEPMPQVQAEPAQFAHYPTPGLTLVGTLPQGPIRGIRQATNGDIYVAAGSGIYLVTVAPFAATLLGSITSGRTTPVSMQDNTLTLVIVDGTTSGWQVDLSSHAFSAISDPTGMFSGADRVDYLDTYLLFNKPGTPQFYTSLSLSVTFDSLYFANKSSYTDLLMTLVVAKREIWLIGERTTEIWYNAATTDFPFGEIQATFVDHGTIAKYSPATFDNSVFWLTLDRQGAPTVMQAAGYQSQRISTFAIENVLTGYVLSDAIGFTFIIGGHAIYALTFPSSDHTWCYDIVTQLWFEWLWVDNAGAEHRSRCNCAYAMRWGQVYAGDWQNGNLYQIDPTNQTDNGQPIKRQRSWQHVLNQGKRLFHREFVADFETGMDGPAPSQPQTLIECFFNGPDGTALGAYVPSPVEINATWIWVAGGIADLANNAAVASQGDTVYASRGPAPPIADYSIAFRVLPNVVAENGASVVVAARAPTTATALSGYWGGLEMTTTGWVAMLQGNVTAIGALPPDGWFDCRLSVLGTAIALTVQRSSDGLYVAPDGQWQSTPTAVLSLTDSTWTAPGQIMLGFNTLGGGVMGTEDATGTWVLEDGSGFSWEWADALPDDSLAIDNIVAITTPSPWLLYLDWSDDRGHTFGNPVGQNMGGAGEYLTQAQWQRLGMCRDRVYRLTFTSPIRTAIQGAWIEVTPALS